MGTAVLLVLLFLTVFASAPRAYASSGSVVYDFGAAVSENSSNYTVFYSAPSVIQAGVKANVTLFVYVTALSGWKIDSQTQILRVTLNTATESVALPQAENQVTLYQGGRWGPFNVTLDLNDSQLGLRPGQETNATLYADLVVYEQYDNPAYPFVVDDGTTLKLTGVEVAAAPAAAGVGDARALASVAVGAVVVGALTGVTLATRSRGGKASAHKAPG
ncbi:MAG TPA: hypothetical protein VLX56_01575 [Nitrososphaerales archaeon]|nr:hypothetical protein [Nitrososphaerales archaeon]